MVRERYDASAASLMGYMPLTFSCLAPGFIGRKSEHSDMDRGGGGAERKTGEFRERRTDGQTNRQAGRKRDRKQTGRQAGRQTDKQMGGWTYRWIEADRNLERKEIRVQKKRENSVLNMDVGRNTLF